MEADDLCFVSAWPLRSNRPVPTARKYHCCSIELEKAPEVAIQSADVCLIVGPLYGHLLNLGRILALARFMNHRRHCGQMSLPDRKWPGIRRTRGN